MVGFSSSMVDSIFGIVSSTQGDDYLSLYSYEGVIDINGCESRLCVKIFGGTLFIPYIVFKNTRLGTAGRLLCEFRKICLELGLKKIVFESVMTDSMKNFCISRNFKCLEDNGFGYCNWELVIGSE